MGSVRGVSLGELGYLRISKVRLGKVRLCYMIKPNINTVILRTKAAVWTKAQSLVLFNDANKIQKILY